LISHTDENVKLSFYLIKYHNMKTYLGVEVWFHIFLTLTLDGGEWSASHCGHFTPTETALVPFGKEGGWDPGCKPGCGGGGEEKKSLPLLGIEPSSSSLWLRHYTDSCSSSHIICSFVKGVFPSFSLH
jgi:hypothetical protein